MLCAEVLKSRRSGQLYAPFMCDSFRVFHTRVCNPVMCGEMGDAQKGLGLNPHALISERRFVGRTPCGRCYALLPSRLRPSGLGKKREKKLVRVWSSRTRNAARPKNGGGVVVGHIEPFVTE